MKFSKEAKIGLSTIIAIFLFIWGFDFLNGKNIFTSSNVFYMVYKELGGLKESNGVLINGFKVGQVTELRLNPDEGRQVMVKILVDKDYKIPKGSVARLASVDFMGTKAIELILSESFEYHQSGDTLNSRVGEGIMDKVADFEEILMQITLGVDSLLQNLNSLLNEEMQEDFHQTMNNVKEISSNMKSLNEHGEITGLIYSLQDLTQSLKAATATLPETMENIKMVTDSLKEAELKMLISQTAQSIENLNLILGKTEKGEGTVGQLVNNDSLYTNLTNATKELELLLNDLRENPKKYVHFSVFGKKDKE